MLTYSLLLALSLAPYVQAAPHCKSTPSDADWPSSDEWSILNNTINGTLIKTTPVASSCWPANSFHSSLGCDAVTANWTSGKFHAELPESIDYPLFSNNSCLPPGVSGYNESDGCHLGGLPEFIVNATSTWQVAIAMKWAAARNIRIVVKGTGHDLNGRSSGAFSLSIWTRGFRGIQRNASWPNPGDRSPHDVFIVGSGEPWGDVLEEALAVGRIVTTGQDPSVGLGGYIQGGGHGPLSSTYGLAAHQVMQVTVVTVNGQVLVANDAQNEDLFWALRGGGGGQFGVVTEYVIRSHPAPGQVASGVLSIVPRSGQETENSWKAAAILTRHWPDLIDTGLTGSATMATGESALSFGSSSATTGVVVTQVFFGYNMTSTRLTELVEPVIAKIRSSVSNGSLVLAWSASTHEDYGSFYKTISGSNAAGGGSVVTSRLLGRTELVDTPLSTVTSYLHTALQGENRTAGMFATIGLQGGPGIANMPEARWGAVNPVWRSAYAHFIAGGAKTDPSEQGGAKGALLHAAAWLEEVKESLWRQWAPKTGAYMNEANPYSTHWKNDFYGGHYDRLLDIKRKYDPTESLYVLSGVGSDEWDYDMETGRLCKVGCAEFNSS